MALAGEWVNKLQSIHAMENYSPIKRSEIIIHVTACMDQLQRHYAEKCQVDKEYMYMKLQKIQIKFIVTEISQRFPEVKGGSWKLPGKEHKGTFWCDEYVLFQCYT